MYVCTYTCMYAYTCLPKHVGLKATIKPIPRELSSPMMRTRRLVDNIEAIVPEVSATLWARLPDDGIFIVVSLRTSVLTSSLGHFHSIT